MENRECFLCQKPNCDLKCPKPDCGIFYCSDSHYSSHIYRIKDTKKNLVHDENNNDIIELDENTICLPYRVENSKAFGRHLIATRDIKALELIICDHPAAVGPATKTRPVCIVCLKPAKSGFR